MVESYLLRLFNQPWDKVPTCWVDFETTGKRPGIDRAVQVALVRFENGKPVAATSTLINPGVPIPAEATSIHGITDEMVDGAPSSHVWFSGDEPRQLLDGAAPGAFNAPFDRHFMPAGALADHTWPWLDSLSMVRFVDRFAPGKGRHKLEAAAARHGVKLEKAHDAASDARAAGELFYLLGQRIFTGDVWSLGKVLERQRINDIREWSRFCSWILSQPPRENG
jgi:DNA polymerase-3 subunit epsilon